VIAPPYCGRTILHLVLNDGDHELTYPERKCKEGVLASLTIPGDTTPKLAGRDDEDGAVSQGGAGYHVFDKVRVPRLIDDLRLEKSAISSRLGLAKSQEIKGSQ
jgi:hypothetical protein